jgi:hypothetical protein
MVRARSSIRAAGLASALHLNYAAQIERGDFIVNRPNLQTVCSSSSVEPNLMPGLIDSEAADGVEDRQA